MDETRYNYRLSAIRLINFMAFEDTDWIELRPITLLFGRNSSGKSAIIRALLLFRQSLEAQSPGTPLVFNGRWVDLGSYYNAVHRHEVQRDIRFGFRLSRPAFDEPAPEPAPDESAEDFRRRQDDYNARRSDYDNQGVDDRWSVHTERGELEVDIDSQQVELTLTFGKLSNLETPALKALQIVGRRELPDGASVEVVVFSCARNERGIWEPCSDAPLNYRLFEGEGEQRRTVLCDQFSDPLWGNFDLDMRDGPIPSRLWVPDVADVRRSDRRPDWEAVDRALELFHQHIAGLLRGMVYLPPLREMPRRYYRADEPWVKALSDPASSLSKEAVNWWLAVASLDAKVDALLLNHDEGLVGVYLREEQNDAPTGFRSNLRDVGAGVAQVLPVIVQTMTAGPDGMVIIEQPELHLHPEAQAALADFFIAMSKPGVGLRFLLETHSSALIYRMRRRIAETKVGWLEEAPQIKLQPDDLSACFVDRRNGKSVLEPIAYNDDGSYARMPVGFDDFFGADYEQLYRLRDAQLEAEHREQDAR